MYPLFSATTQEQQEQGEPREEEEPEENNEHKQNKEEQRVEGSIEEKEQPPEQEGIYHAGPPSKSESNYALYIMSLFPSIPSTSGDEEHFSTPAATPSTVKKKRAKRDWNLPPTPGMHRMTTRHSSLPEIAVEIEM